MKTYILIFVLISVILISGCTQQNSANNQEQLIDREAKIPADAVKMTPSLDDYPPQLHSEEYKTPVPLQYPINTKGAEDSPFIQADKNELYFFFTPDVRVPVERQVADSVTGIYVSKNVNGEWQKPERVMLQDKGKLSLDGCEFVENNKMWFCSAREGYTGIHWFTADFIDRKWANWQNADFKPEHDVGELHIHDDELYFHSARTGSKGGLDIWVSKNINGEWSEPQNIDIVNTAENDGWPFIKKDGSELWFTRTYFGTPAVFRSKRINNEWQEPELIISQFAGEPTLDSKGNVYFVHHFYKNNTMIEADIYVAERK
jgi:hypothetical protein